MSRGLGLRRAPGWPFCAVVGSIRVVLVRQVEIIWTTDVGGRCHRGKMVMMTDA